MARINLLPWRQEERERKNKEFLALAAAAAVLAILAILLALTFLNNTLSNQELANQKIEDENTRLDAVLTEISTLEEQRDAMLSRIKIIQDLQGRRSVPVRVWDDIARATPQALYLTAMKREGDTITFTGRADNANIVSEFARNLNNSAWLKNSSIPNISGNTQNQSSQTPQLLENNYVSFVVTTIVSDEIQAQAPNDNQTAFDNQQQDTSESLVVVSDSIEQGQATQQLTAEEVDKTVGVDDVSGNQSIGGQ